MRTDQYGMPIENFFSRTSSSARTLESKLAHLMQDTQGKKEEERLKAFDSQSDDIGKSFSSLVENLRREKTLGSLHEELIDFSPRKLGVNIDNILSYINSFIRYEADSDNQIKSQFSLFKDMLLSGLEEVLSYTDNNKSELESDNPDRPQLVDLELRKKYLEKGLISQN